MDRPVTVNDGSSIRSFAPSHAGTATSSFKNAAKFSRNYDSDDDDNDSKLRTKNLRLNEIKRSDTRVAEDRHSWANAGSSGFSNAYQTSSMTSGTKSRHSKGSRLPPAFATQPLVENDPPRQGYLYQLHKPDLPPSVPTWNTIDPETGAVSGAHRAKKAKHSNNPNHPMNHPLAATFGTINVQEAPDDDDDNATYLTAENLEEQQMFVPQQETADTVAGYCETVLFEADSAAAFYRAPSADDGFDLRSVGSSERPSEKSSVIMSDDGSDASDRTYRPNITNNPRIHRDIRANFISNVDDLHNVDKKSEFQKLNSDWLASDPTTGNVKQINMQLGENNVVAMAVKSEVRTRLFDWHGRYIDGKDRGQVSKRFRRGFLEMVEALEKEMIQASAVYRKWRLMSPTERVRLLEEIRRPVVQFNGTWAPTERDTMEAPLPLIYQKRIEDRYIKAQKLRDLLRERSSNAARTKSVTSHVSHDTREPKNGTLGDCDSEYISEGSIGGTPAGFDDRSRADESFRRAKQNVEESLRRAIRFSEREYSSRVSCRSRQSERRQRDSEQITASLAASSASSRRSSMQTPQQRANDIRGSFQGSGISVAGPRHTSSVKSNATAKPPPSTIRNIRTHGHGGSSSVAQSVGSRNSLDNLSDLLDFDDSPELQLPEDVTGCEAFEFDKPADQELYDIGLRNAQNRGRVVVVRLHQPVEFTPGVIANKVFGGIVQEFQLHPERATAVVVFMHPNEARSFVHHFINVKSHGTEQERRELQMEVSWYK